jgi:Zn-dependent peptidase ImmA (M78 family)
MTTTSAANPVWLRLKRRGVRTAAQILEHFSIHTPPVDVDDIAARLEVYVHRVAGMKTSGAVNSNARGAAIYVSEDDVPWRQRFTIAHELGHLMLHEEGSLHHRDTTFTGGPIEQQANAFAADLLMPFPMVMIAAQSTGGSPKRMARLFDVSEAAMSVRMANLRFWNVR